MTPVSFAVMNQTKAQAGIEAMRNQLEEQSAKLILLEERLQAMELKLLDAEVPVNSSYRVDTPLPEEFPTTLAELRDLSEDQLARIENFYDLGQFGTLQNRIRRLERLCMRTVGGGELGDFFY